jgi:hypothetical protein
MKRKMLKASWTAYQQAVRGLNLSVRDLFEVGDRVQVDCGKTGWRDGTVTWVPHENGPPASHIYVLIDGHKQPRPFYMGDGCFDNVMFDDEG